MKKILFTLIAFFLVVDGFGQHTVVPYPIQNRQIVPGDLPAGGATIYSPSAIIAPADPQFLNNGTITVPSTGTYIFRAGTFIKLNPTFIAQPIGGSFAAEIAPVDLPIVIYSPAQTQASLQTYCYQYEKFEFGLKLPTVVQTAIDNFIAGSGTPQINPFNPEQLDIQVLYYHYSNNTYTNSDAQYQGFGFYYREYHRDVSDPDPNNWVHVEDTTSFKIRARFAAPTLGSWKAVVTVNAPTIQYSNTASFQFTCLASTDPNNHGFVTTVPGKRWFELGGNTFLPVGQNLPWPGNEPGYLNVGAGYSLAQDKVAHYVFYENKIAELASDGANYFRTILAPESDDFEFEHLNNYYDRLSSAWEVDRILDKALEQNMYVHFNMFLHYQLEDQAAYVNIFWNWAANDCSVFPENGYCYANGVGSLGLNSPLSFLSDVNAKKFYKYKLRYLFSRWGYARQVAVFEQASEINNWGQVWTPIDPNTGNCHYSGPIAYNPYADPSNTIRQNIFAWHTEMTDYIRQNLGFQRLLAVNYTGSPASPDNSFYINGVSVNSYNNYSKTEFVNNAPHNASFYFGICNKPVMHSEVGGINDPQCNNVDWYRTIWAYTFSGLACGMNWSGNDQPQLWPFYNLVNNFVSGFEDLNDGNFSPDYQLRGDHESEMVCLKSTSTNKVYGAIFNRNFNCYTKKTCSTCDANNDYPGADIDNIQDISWNSGPDELEVQNLTALTNFDVEYYDGLTGVGLDFDNQISDFNGKIVLHHPQLTMTNPEDYHPIIIFKISTNGGNRIVNQPLQTIADSITMSQAKKQKDSFINSLETEIKISPIPADNSLSITNASNASGTFSYSILSATGQLIYQSEKTNASTIDIDTDNIPNGVYFLKIEGTDLRTMRTFTILHQ